MKKVILETERLILRTWDAADIQPYFDINQDPEVIQFLRGPLVMQEVQDYIAAVNDHQDKHGYTLWAAEIKETRQLIGYIGLNYIDWYGALFTLAVEVGWRLGSQY